MNDQGANSLLHSKVKLGADISAAAGPVGRSASADTDAYLRSEILELPRAHSLRRNFTRRLHAAARMTAPTAALWPRCQRRDIVNGSEVPTPEAGHELIARSIRASPKLNTS